MADFEKWEQIPAELRDACKWSGVILMQAKSRQYTSTADSGKPKIAAF